MVFYLSLITFALVEKKKTISGLIFGLIVLSAITLQSIHSCLHLVNLFAEKECHHHYSPNKTEFSHAHHNFENCFACEFTFSTSIKLDSFNFYFKKIQISTSCFSNYFKKYTPAFPGSLFVLRGPPNVLN